MSEKPWLSEALLHYEFRLQLHLVVTQSSKHYRSQNSVFLLSKPIYSETASVGHSSIQHVWPVLLALRHFHAALAIWGWRRLNLFEVATCRFPRALSLCDTSELEICPNCLTNTEQLPQLQMGKWVNTDDLHWFTQEMASILKNIQKNTLTDDG